MARTSGTRPGDSGLRREAELDPPGLVDRSVEDLVVQGLRRRGVEVDDRTVGR